MALRDVSITKITSWYSSISVLEEQSCRYAQNGSRILQSFQNPNSIYFFLVMLVIPAGQ